MCIEWAENIAELLPENTIHIRFELDGKTCALNPRCKLKKMLKNATNSFVSELEKYKIKDLV